MGLDLGFWCGGLEINVDSLDWRSALMEWWFGDWRRWTGDQPHFDSLSSLTPILYLRLGLCFGIALIFLL